MSGTDHLDVASYALGALDPVETARFEEHLAECWNCARELETLLPVVDLLGEIDAEDLVVAEQSVSDGRLLDRMLVAVSEDRRRERSRRLFSLAAGVVLLAMLTGFALFAGGQWLAEPGTNTAGPGGRDTGSVPSAPPPITSSPGFGVGGPELDAGERLTATDETTGVEATLLLQSEPFGTQISFALAKLTGPQNCRLVVLRKSGSAEVVSSWSVPVTGYGTGAEPAPLLLQTTTAAPRSDIDRIQVQAIDLKGVATALVTVPV
ncbi:zf-HC2 domain-containing protein [Solwaraspora sp. WMMD1047]|uniref:anti-sigma factor family protein n=1 Tax=Solwaraspora sp. WMMD1047 TaxID=3016102 RepID=UPI002416F1F2|nr:zf-HC2 domain-containing protein [Solwaraspora sp. WMMD1047]MDG4829875.1 zf-HC2 domain-containing protein [Solwaraspora sp. WMMD1047]